MIIIIIIYNNNNNPHYALFKYSYSVQDDNEKKYHVAPGSIFSRRKQIFSFVYLFFIEFIVKSQRIKYNFKMICRFYFG